MKILLNADPSSLQQNVLRYYDALDMAGKMNLFFSSENVIGIVGGTLDEKSHNLNALSKKDMCLLTGECNANRHTSLPTIRMPIFEVPYRMGKTIEEQEENVAVYNALVDKIKGKKIYSAGGFIANPAERIFGYGVSAKDLDKVTVGQMIENAIEPVTFDMEPSTDPELYTESAEDFRIKDHRPNWMLKIKEGHSNKFYKPVPKATNSQGYAEIPKDKFKYMTKKLVPMGDGSEWIIDYGYLSVDENHIRAAGAHGLSTLGINTCLAFVEYLKESKTTVLGNDQVMSSLKYILEGEKLNNYQAIIRAEKSYDDSGDPVINNRLLGVFGLN